MISPSQEVGLSRPVPVPFLIIGVLLLAVVTVGCQGQTGGPAVQAARVQVNSGFYTNITPGQLALMLKSKDFTFINVHIPYDGEIEKTDSFLPFDDITQNLNRLPEDRNAKIVLYCRSGSMSTSAARDLVQAGYTNVWNLDGGMMAWKAQGYEVLRKR